MTKPLPLSARARSIGESATLAIAAKAKQLRDSGHDVISLGAGEPDFPTVEAVAAAGIAAIEQGDTRYTPAAGTPALRAAAAAWFGRTYGLEYTAEQVLVTAGAKPALHMALSALVEPGDAVLLLAPYWVSYPDLVRVSGGTPEVVPAAPERGFVHDAGRIADAARRCAAKGIVLNSPNNPSGAVWPRAAIEALVEVARDAGLWILSDEIYGRILHGDAEHVSPAALAPERTLVVNGGTKSHSMTGWRVGFLAGPEEVVAAAARIQSQVIGNACTISQRAAQVLCEGDFDAELRARSAAYGERRQVLLDAIARVRGLGLEPPAGAFYALVDARPWCERIAADDIALAGRLLDEASVAVVPGTPFGIPGFIRISYAAAADEIREALDRLAAFGQRL